VRPLLACPLLACLLLAMALPAGAETLRIDGEVYARSSAQIMPPAVEGMWQFNITQLAPDGAPLKKGAVAVAFDASTVMKSLAEKNSKLQEKQRELDRLQLELAERKRSSHLETEKARAELEKARRKTEQPQELIAGIEYRKLVVARTQAERKLALARELERANAEQRTQELRLVRSEIAQLSADVARLGKAQGELTIAAPRSGILMHRSSWNGEKFDVGSQVWMGQTIAEIPDPATLAVRAELPERDYLRVRPGMAARVRVEGGAGVFPARIASIGRAVRSKSQAQPSPVLDVELRLDDADARLKPGQTVRVELTVPDVAAAAPAAAAAVAP
jgi:multidrug resistance efflux pump